MNTKQIDAILELSKTLNFNRAAEKLYVSQPTLSYEIKEAEREIGFAIFERSGKGAVLTPAGAQFCTALRTIREELRNAIEQGQNFSQRYKDDITIGLPIRSALLPLPKVIEQFARKFPQVSISPKFNGFYNSEAFLRGEQDILFAMDFEMKHVPNIKVHPLYTCPIYLVTRKDDPLSKKKLIKEKDLYGRTLLVGGGSPPALQRVQKRLMQTGKIRYFNSANHQTTLVQVAAGKAVCLSPGFFNDFTNEFSWIRFDCEEHFNCVLCTHITDKRDSVQTFIELLQKSY